MSKEKYMTLHDLRDILDIYRDCEDYKVKIWCFTEYDHFTLSHTYLITDLSTEIPKIIIDASQKNNSRGKHTIQTLKDLKDFVNNIYNIGTKLDNAKIEILNIDNYHLMTLVFTGSSNMTKEINFNIEYEGDYREWKRKFRWKFIYIKHKIKNWYRNLNHKLYGRKRY